MAGRSEVTLACCQGIEIDVLVDLADLTFMDCGGYRGLLQARVALERCGGSLTLTEAVGEAARFLELLGDDAAMLKPAVERRIVAA